MDSPGASSGSFEVLRSRRIRRRKSTVKHTHKIFLNNAVYRLGLLSLLLAIYYGINVWYYNTYSPHIDEDCGHDLLWCNTLESKLFIASTTTFLVTSLVVLVFVISMYKTYSYEQNFHTQWNVINSVTVLLVPLILISSCIILIIYSSLYINSYISTHNYFNKTQKQSIIFHQITILLNQIGITIMLALDFFNLHYYFIKRRKNAKNCLSSMLNIMDIQSTRIAFMSAILFILSWGFVSSYSMDDILVVNNGELHKYDDIKTSGWLVHAVITMFIFFRYAFQKLDPSKQVVRIEMQNNQQRLLLNNNDNEEINIVYGYTQRLLFGIIFAFCLFCGLILLWIGKIYDVHFYLNHHSPYDTSQNYLNKGVDVAIFISPEVMYSFQIIVICLDMIIIKK